jgi:hypothetical protein
MSFSRSSKPQSSGVMAPTSSAMVVMLSRWFRIRVISENSTRMYCARLGISMPSSFSIART